MVKQWKRRAVFALAILLTASLTGCANGAAYEDHPEPAVFQGAGDGTGSSASYSEEKSFDAGEFDSISVRAEAMDIYVTKSTDQNAHVELVTTDALRKRMSFQSSVDARVLELRVDEENIVTVFPDRKMAGERKLLISLPDKKYGTVKIRNNFGTVEAENVQADAVEIELDAGDIRLNRVTGQMSLVSEAGDIIVEGVQLNRDLTARTEAGDIYVQLAESPQDAKVSLSTELGNVTSDLKDLNITQNRGNRIIGSIGTGGYALDVSATVGNITIDAP